MKVTAIEYNAKDLTPVFLMGDDTLQFNEYQRATEVTRRNTGIPEVDYLNAALGISGEAGEIADLIKKWQFHGHELDRTKIREELGDLLWYVAWMSDQLGYRMSNVAEMNIAKLKQRYPNGFSTEDSLARKDKQNVP